MEEYLVPAHRNQHFQWFGATTGMPKMRKVKLRKDFIGFTRLPWPTPVFMASPTTKSVMLWIVMSRLGRSGFAGGSGHAESRDLGGCCGGTASCRGLPACLRGAATALCSYS